MIQSLSSANLAMLPAAYFGANQTLAIRAPLVVPGSDFLTRCTADAQNLSNIIRTLHEFPGEVFRRLLTGEPSVPEISIDDYSYNRAKTRDGVGVKTEKIKVRDRRGESWTVDASEFGRERFEAKLSGTGGKSITARVFMGSGGNPDSNFSITEGGRIFLIRRMARSKALDGEFLFDMDLSFRVEKGSIDQGLLTYLGWPPEKVTPAMAARLFYEHFLKEGCKPLDDLKPYRVLEDHHHIFSFRSENDRIDDSLYSFESTVEVPDTGTVKILVTPKSRDSQDGREIPTSVRKLLELDGNNLAIGVGR